MVWYHVFSLGGGLGSLWFSFARGAPKSLETLLLKMYSDNDSVTSTPVLQTSLILKMPFERKPWDDGSWQMARNLLGREQNKVSRFPYNNEKKQTKKEKLIKVELGREALKNFPTSSWAEQIESCWLLHISTFFTLSPSARCDLYPCWQLHWAQWTATLVKVIRQT